MVAIFNLIDFIFKVFDKVRMYEEIMMNDDNLESNLLTPSLLKKMSGLHAGTC